MQLIAQPRNKKLEEVQALMLKRRTEREAQLANYRAKLHQVDAKLKALQAHNLKLTELLKRKIKEKRESQAVVLRRPRQNYSLFEAQQEEFQVDLDHMTYEQILELQEQIGKVCVGLGEEEIGRLQVTECKEEGTCIFCMERMEEGSMSVQLPCLHRFHQKCIREWLLNSKHCPVCQRDVLEGQKHQ